MKTFANTKASQPSAGGFTSIKDDYWKEANIVPRASAERHAIRFSIISWMVPLRTHSAELLNGKTFPTACLAFNPATEEYDAGRCPFCEWEYLSACNYLVKVLVHDWLENPATNPHPERGAVAILELTKGMITDIANVNTTWQLDPETGGICNPESGVMLSLTAARKGGNPKGPLEYSIQGVPCRLPITQAWLDENYASGAFTDWDLDRYAKSKYMRASDLLPFLAYNGYSKDMAWFDGLAQDLQNRNDHFNNLLPTQEEADAWNAQLDDTPEAKRETRFVYLGEKGVRNRVEKGLNDFLAKSGNADASGGYQQSGYDNQSAGAMGFGSNGGQAPSAPAGQTPSAPAGAPAPTPAPAPNPASTPAPSAPAGGPAPAPRPAPAPAPAGAPAGGSAPRPAGAPAPAPRPAAPAPAPAPLGAPKPNL